VNFVDLDGLFHIPAGYTYVSTKNMTYQDKLARYILQKLICKSIKNNKEYGGSFAKNSYTNALEYFSGTSRGSSHIEYPDVDAVFSLHTHGCWDKKNVGKNTDWNETYSQKDAKIVKNYNIPNYLGTPSGRMYYLEYKNNSFFMKIFPDLDLSNCKCPNKMPYNESWFPNKCGSLK
jgi:hypothetical protein